MDGVASFIAESLLQRVRSTSPGAELPLCAPFAGAVLFVDISRYTELAEELCKQGPEGVEALGRTLDGVLAAYVYAVYETGGEIACFAGDACLAYWAAAAGDLSDARSRAEGCARRLQTVARGRATTSATTPALHIGLGAGELWAALLGDVTHWQLLLAGPAVRQACAAAVRAREGETVIAPDQAPETHAAPARPTHVPDGENAVVDGPTVELTAHLPKRVQDYVAHGYSAWLPDARKICALFVRIDGLDERTPDALLHYQVAVTSLRTVVRPYTSAPGTLLLDDKGLVFTLCFGLPQDSGGDIAKHAVRAGLAIKAELTRLGLQCEAGIDLGDGVCMAIGGHARRHYWSGGRFMHIAARLMGAAGSGVLCTEAVANLVRDIVGLSPERPLTLKGVRRPIRVFRVREATLLSHSPEQLFGRDDEQARLNRALDACERGSGGVLWIVGDAGVGKTALVQSTRRAAEHRGLTCLSGGAGSMGISTAYAAWAPVFAGLIGEEASWQALNREERTSRLGPLRHPQFAPLVNVVLPGFLDERTLPDSLVGQARADAIAAVLSEIITTHASSGIVLVLEDCHWIDSASWRLLLRVAQDHPRALIVLTSRQTVSGHELATLRRLHGFEEMSLTGLRDEAIRALIESVVERESIGPGFVEEIMHRCGGNPLLAREYALLAITGSHQADRDLAAPAGQGTEESVEGRMRPLIQSRLDALTPVEHLALNGASVIGDRFSVGLLAAVVVEVQRDGLLAALAQLTEHQLIEPAGPGPGNYAFQHAVIRHATYASLLPGQQRELHRRTAMAIEAQDGDDGPHVSTLAHHWQKAGEVGPTIRAADRAASRALAAGGFTEAERLLEMCLERAGADVPRGDRIRWHGQLADARHGMGLLEPRAAAAQEALRLAGVRRPRATAGLLLYAASDACRIAVRRWRPIEDVRERDRMMAMARAYRHSAEVCYFHNDRFGMLANTVAAVAHASVGTPSAVLAGASTELGGLLTIGGLRRTGERILQQTIASAQSSGDEAAQAYAHMISCLYFVGIANWEAAEESVKRCQELCTPMDDRVNATNAQAVRFWMSHYRGHDVAAYDAARNLRDRASETGNRQHRAWAGRFLALCALRRNEPDEALQLLAPAWEALSETGALNEKIPTVGLQALALLGVRQEWKAHAKAAEVMPRLAHIGRPMGHATLEGYSALFTVALDACRKEGSPEWRRGVAACLRLLKAHQSSFAVGKARYLFHRGEYEQLVGRNARARASFIEGYRVAKRLGMPWDARRCRERARRLPA